MQLKPRKQKTRALRQKPRRLEKCDLQPKPGQQKRSVLQQKPRRLKRRALQPKPKQTLYYREHSLAAFGILQESSAQPVHEIGQLRKQARGALLQ